MECPICGHKLGENDAFCSNCGNFALPLRDHSNSVPSPAFTMGDNSVETHSHKVAERLYPPETDLNTPFEPEYRASMRSSSPCSSGNTDSERKSTLSKNTVLHMTKNETENRLKIFSVICCVLMAIAIGVAVYVSVTSSNLRVQLHMAQKESSTAQANIENLESQVSVLSENLETTRQENTSLGSQVAQLQGQVSELESTINQSTYDKENMERQLEEAMGQLSETTAENSDLTAELAEAQNALKVIQAENEALYNENDSLHTVVSTFETQIDFFDTYVVFVMLSNSDKYYHKYSCSEFTQRNFLAYSVKLAEANGYTPCPICFGPSDSDSDVENKVETDVDT